MTASAQRIECTSLTIFGSSCDPITIAVTPDGAGVDFLGSITRKEIT